MMEKDICEEIAEVSGKIHGERSDAEVTGVLQRCHEAITALRMRAHEVDLKLQQFGRIEHGEPEPVPPPMSEPEPSWERTPQFEPPPPPPGPVLEPGWVPPDPPLPPDPPRAHEAEQKLQHLHEHKGKHDHKHKK